MYTTYTNTNKWFLFSILDVNTSYNIWDNATFVCAVVSFNVDVEIEEGK